jgi:hypothetical protein
MAQIAACAATTRQAAPTASKEGNLPASGRIILRSGLEWTDETSPLFQSMRSALLPLLAAKGIRVVDASPSRLALLPRSVPAEYEHLEKLSRNKENLHRLAQKRVAEANRRPTIASATNDPRVSAADGQKQGGEKEIAVQEKPYPLRLARYAVPERDADLPASVMAVKPVDTETLLFAASQKRGFPLLRHEGKIPGHVPAETSTVDPVSAEYSLLIRFAAVQSFSGGLPDIRGIGAARSVLSAAYINGSMVTAGPVRGVGALGPAPPPQSAPPRPAYGASPGDYARGYEGMSPIPGDPWHREADLHDPGYRSRHAPPPVYATPPQVPARRDDGPIIEPYNPTLPKPPLPGDSDPPGRTKPQSSRLVPYTEPYPGTWADDAPAVIEGGVAIQSYLLEMDCYVLDPAGGHGKPVLVWHCRAQQEAGPSGLRATLPEMAAICFKEPLI